VLYTACDIFSILPHKVVLNFKTSSDIFHWLDFFRSLVSPLGFSHALVA
jgi:hypothetical protein